MQRYWSSTSTNTIQSSLLLSPSLKRYSKLRMSWTTSFNWWEKTLFPRTKNALLKLPVLSERTSWSKMLSPNTTTIVLCIKLLEWWSVFVYSLIWEWKPSLRAAVMLKSLGVWLRLNWKKSCMSWPNWNLSCLRLLKKTWINYSKNWRVSLKRNSENWQND